MTQSTDSASQRIPTQEFIAYLLINGAFLVCYYTYFYSPFKISSQGANWVLEKSLFTIPAIVFSLVTASFSFILIYLSVEKNCQSCYYFSHCL